MVTQHLKAMAFNNAWANHRLLKAVLQLSHEEFRAKGTSFFPSIKATLNHNVTVDWFYVDALERALRGEPMNPEGRKFFEPEEPFDDASSLSRAQRAVDRRLIELCSTLTSERLETLVAVPWKVTGNERAHRVLLHLFQHQVHHRGQAHAMLAGTSIAPPQLDEFFCAGDASVRARDFEELGFTEDAIWADIGEPSS